MKVREGEGHFSVIFRVGRVVTKKKVAKENEVTELPGVGTVERVRFLYLGFGSFRCRIATPELLSHQHNGLGEIRGRLVAKRITRCIFRGSITVVSISRGTGTVGSWGYWATLTFSTHIRSM